MEANEIGRIIKELRQKRNMTQEELAEAIGKSRNYLAMIESGKRQGKFILKQIADVLGVDVAVIYGEKPMPPVKPRPKSLRSLFREFEDKMKGMEIREIPVLGYVPAGQPLAAEESAAGHIPVPKEILGIYQDKPGLFAVIVSGESLKGDGILPGDYLIVDPGQKEIVNGRVYICRIENEVTAKHVFLFDDKVQLVPSNDKYNIIEPQQLEILGRVIKSIKMIDL